MLKIRGIFLCVILFLIACTSDVLTTPSQDPIPLSDEYLSLLEEESPTEALELLKERLLADPSLANQCHMIVHHIGHAALLKYNFEAAMAYADDICGSGYMHGVTEMYISGMEDPLLALKEVCPAGYGACFHGVGHGLFMYYGGDILVSLTGCSDFENSEEEIQCSEGVFMENFSTDLNAHANQNLDSSNPLNICSQQADQYKSACYFYGPRYVLTIEPGDYAHAFLLCSEVEEGFIYQCARGVGSALMRQNLDKHSFVVETCLSLTDELSNGCFSGATSYYVIHTGSLADAASFCNEVPESADAVCQSTLESSRGFFLDAL